MPRHPGRRAPGRWGTSTAASEAREAANDNALVRIAQEIPSRGQRLASRRGGGRVRGPSARRFWRPGTICASGLVTMARPWL